MVNASLAGYANGGLFRMVGLRSRRAAPAADGELEACDDETLVELSRQGSQPAFEELVLRYRGRVTRVAMRFFPRVEDAEDIAQDTFVRAFLKLKKLRRGVPFENWVVRIAINLSLDRLRYSRRRPEDSVSQLGDEAEDWLERFFGRESVDEGDRTAQRTEAREILEKVLPMISPKDQGILHLIYGEGMNSTEIAGLMGSSDVNIRVRAHRAKRELKKAIESLMEGR